VPIPAVATACCQPEGSIDEEVYVSADELIAPPGRAAGDRAYRDVRRGASK
jgi:hypothetical protein